VPDLLCLQDPLRQNQEHPCRNLKLLLLNLLLHYRKDQKQGFKAVLLNLSNILMGVYDGVMLVLHESQAMFRRNLVIHVGRKPCKTNMMHCFVIICGVWYPTSQALISLIADGSSRLRERPMGQLTDIKEG
jgi:hypothetical protein